MSQTKVSCFLTHYLHLGRHLSLFPCVTELQWHSLRCLFFFKTHHVYLNFYTASQFQDRILGGSFCWNRKFSLVTTDIEVTRLYFSVLQNYWNGSSTLTIPDNWTSKSYSRLLSPWQILISCWNVELEWNNWFCRFSQFCCVAFFFTIHITSTKLTSTFLFWSGEKCFLLMYIDMTNKPFFYVRSAEFDMAMATVPWAISLCGSIRLSLTA